jgi:hypothetical protein
LLSLVLVAATLVAYANGLQSAFVYDDRDTVIWDRHLGDFSSLTRVLLGVRGGPTGGRPLTSLTFHLNALIAGKKPAGYRAVNILIHLGAGLVLCALLRRVLAAGRGVTGQTGDAAATAFAVSLLWLLHPMQTESVTYVSQRAESLMGLLFLVTVYCAVRGFQAADPAPWFRGATVACTLSVLSRSVSWRRSWFSSTTGCWSRGVAPCAQRSTGGCTSAWRSRGLLRACCSSPHRAATPVACRTLTCRRGDTSSANSSVSPTT